MRLQELDYSTRERAESFPMASAFSQQLEELLNPLPKFHDPEDEEDEATKAKVIDRFQEEDEEDENEAAPSALRKNSCALLETDARYRGRKVSRNELVMDTEANSDDTEEEDDEEGGTGELSDEGGEEEEEDGDEDDSEGGDEENSEGGDEVTVRDADFHNLTDEMDDLSVNEEDDSVGDEDGAPEESEAEEEGGVHTFSQDKADEEVEKGMAVRNQLALWDQTLEGRIKIQKALLTANQLPQPETFPEFQRRGGARFAGQLKDARRALKALQRSLLELHDQLLLQKEQTSSIALETSAAGGDGDAHLPKRKLELAQYPDFMAKRVAAFQPFQNATLQKWHDRTRLAAGKGSKGFGAFDRNVLTQVDQVLLDRDRLVRRTQTQRSQYRILGKEEAPGLAAEGGAAELKANAHLKQVDEDVFDDDDFYHQLLRELIELKTSGAEAGQQAALGHQWLAIQRLRSKMRKKVDTKASKGRKVKFQVHNKLVNFMAPVDQSSLSQSGRTELFRGLFGQTSTAGE